MKDEKQIIEKMAKDVAHSISWCDDVIPTVDCLGTAAALYGIGYRRQSEGKWTRVEINGVNYGQVYYQHKECEVNETQLFPSPYKVIKNRFNRLTPKIKQVFCRHEYEFKREDCCNERCYYEKCKKCGFFKTIEYYKDERR